ncbi:replication initiator [Nocardia sp. NPDC047654]|uniref:replication initiator n=1 Tax=Nocardia sp. NPDC047654 TaxID=3364314 RepID=UPI003721C15D
MEPTTQNVVPLRQTAAQRRAMPDFRDIAEALADKHKICRRPVPMRVYDPKTLTEYYVGAPCKSTIASVCPACAEQNRYLRITQCREGWHLDEEPVNEVNEPTQQQQDLLACRSDLFNVYQAAKQDGDQQRMDDAAEDVAGIDKQLRATGLRKSLPPLEVSGKKRRVRSTRRRQDAPNLPRKKVAKTTIGREFAGKFRPSMMLTLTMPSYGHVHRDGAVNSKGEPCGDGSPIDPDTYDYARAARDIVHFAGLLDRLMQNLRRAVGWNVQYYGVVEPQRRGAPHIHMLIRGTVPRELVKQVIDATYHQVWWPHFDPEEEIYPGDKVPVWDDRKLTFVDPDTGEVLPTFDERQECLATVKNPKPAHVVRFGTQIDRKTLRGVLGNSEEAGRHIGYITKYLTKSIGEILEPPNTRTAVHYDRLHAELQHVPCSKTCPVWLRFGIVPAGVNEKTVPGRCRGKVHRRDLLGLPGKRVKNSRQWSGKTLPDHKAERAEFVRQLLALVGIVKPDTSHLQVTPVEPGDQAVPPRDHLIMSSISQRLAWKAEYNRALLDAGPAALQQLSAMRQAA